MENYSKKHTLLPTLSLFTSFGTLICCALPALLVSLGAGATLAGLWSNYPQLTVISTYKVEVFIISFVLICGAGFGLYNARNLPCPADAAKAKACARLRKFSIWVWGISAVIWSVGAFFAFLAAKLFY